MMRTSLGPTFFPFFFPSVSAPSPAPGHPEVIISVGDTVPGFPDLTFFEFGLKRGVTPAIDGTDIVFWGKDPSRIYRITDHPIPAVSAPALALSALLLITLATAIITRRKRTA